MADAAPSYSELENQVAQLKAHIVDIENQREVEQNSAQESPQTIINLTQANKKLEEDNEAFRKQIDERRAKDEQIRAAVASSPDEWPISTLKYYIHLVELIISEHAAEIDRLNGLLNKKEMEKLAHADVCSVAQQQLPPLQNVPASIGELVRSLTVARKRVETAQTYSERLEQNLLQRNLTIQNLTSRISTEDPAKVIADSITHENQLQAKDDTITSLRSENQELQAQIDQLLGQATGVTGESSNGDSDMDDERDNALANDVESRIAALHEQLETARTNNEALRTDLSDDLTLAFPPLMIKDDLTDEPRLKLEVKRVQEDNTLLYIVSEQELESETAFLKSPADDDQVDERLASIVEEHRGQITCSGARRHLSDVFKLLQGRIVEFARRIHELNEHVNQGSPNEGVLYEEVQTMTKEIQRLRAKVTKLQESAKAGGNVQNTEEHSKKLAAAEKKVKDLKKKLKDQQEEHDNQTATIQNSLDRCNKRTQDLEANINSTDEERFAKMGDVLDLQRTRIAELEDSLKEEQNAHMLVKRSLDTINNIITSLDPESDAAPAEQVQSMSQNIATLDSKIADLERRLHEERDAHEATKNALDECNDKAASNGSSSSATDSQTVQELEDALKAKTLELTSIQRYLKDQIEESNRLKRHLADLRIQFANSGPSNLSAAQAQAIQELMNTVSTLTARITELENELQGEQNQVLRFRATIAGDSERLLESQSIIDSQNIRLAELERSLQDQTTAAQGHEEVDSLLEQIEAYKLRIEQLEKDVKAEKDKRLAEKKRIKKILESRVYSWKMADDSPTKLTFETHQAGCEEENKKIQDLEAELEWEREQVADLVKQLQHEKVDHKKLQAQLDQSSQRQVTMQAEGSSSDEPSISGKKKELQNQLAVERSKVSILKTQLEGQVSQRKSTSSTTQTQKRQRTVNFSIETLSSSSEETQSHDDPAEAKTQRKRSWDEKWQQRKRRARERNTRSQPYRPPNMIGPREIQNLKIDMKEHAYKPTKFMKSG